MKLAVISVTARGLEIATKIVTILSEKQDVTCYTFEKYPARKAVLYSDMQLLINEIFSKYDGLIFVCACAIAVRKIAPLLRSKLTDPAVVTIDENASFVISLLSGHIGGANDLTEFIAKKIGALPVVTTATDTGKKFSPDSFAVANNLHICNMKAVKMIATEVLNGKSIGFSSDYKCKNIPSEFVTQGSMKYGICISDNCEKKPYRNTLYLLPKNIVLGFGCRKNAPFEKFEIFILKMLEINNINISSISYAATIVIKKDEEAIQKFCQKYEIPLKLYTAQQLMSIKGKFSSSEFVMKITGADNICERAAAMNGGKIIVSKTSENSMTFAAAMNDIDIDFERRIL